MPTSPTVAEPNVIRPPTSGEPSPACDKTQALAFVAALTGSPSTPCTFQLFGEGGDSHDRSQARHFHGTVEERWPELELANSSGCGVFVTVNETDGRGRRAENITAVRALFVDDDSCQLAPDAPEFERCRPNISVRSGRGLHAYWTLLPGAPLEAFTEAQETLALHFGTDPKVKDLPRVMRLPGTLWMKDRAAPRLVTLVHADGAPRSLADVLAALPSKPLLRLVAPLPMSQWERLPPTSKVTDTPERARAYVAKMHALQGDGGDETTFKAAAILVKDFALSESDAWAILCEWNSTNATPPWGEKDLRAKLASAMKSGSHAVGSKLDSTRARAAPTGVSTGRSPDESPGLAPRWRSFTVSELREAPPEKDFIWDGRIPLGDAGVLAGAGAGGKTSLLVGLAVHRAIGWPFLGRPVKQGTTVFVSTEDGHAEYRRKLAAWKECIIDLDLELVSKHIHMVDLSGVPFRLIQSSFGDYIPTPQVEDLAALIRERAPDADLVVLETVSRLGGDEGNPAMSVMVVAAEQLAAATKASVLLVTHVSKAASRERNGDAYAPRGGSAITDNGRYTITLTGIADDKAEDLLGFKPTSEVLEDLLVLAVPKINSAPRQKPVVIQRHPTPWGITLREYEGHGKTGDPGEVARHRRQVTGARLRALVVRIAGQGGKPATINRIAENYRDEVGLAKSKVDRAVSEAIEDGYLAWGGKVQGGGLSLVPGPEIGTLPELPQRNSPSSPGTHGRGPGVVGTTPPAQVLRGEVSSIVSSGIPNDVGEGRGPELPRSLPELEAASAGEFAQATLPSVVGGGYDE